MDDSPRRFVSKVDWWLGALLALLPCVGIGIIISGASSGNSEELWSGAISLGVTALIYGGLIFPLYYEVTDTHLVIRSGLLRHRIPLARITAVAPSRNLLSAPALSLRRMRVDFEGRGGFALVSPRERDAFLTALAAAAGLQRDGEHLKR